MADGKESLYDSLFKDGGFSLDQSVKAPEVGSEELHDVAAMSIIGGNRAAWLNYTNDVIYETDKLLRAWLEEQCKIPSWAGSGKSAARNRTYSFKTLFEILYKRKWVPEEDSHLSVPMSKVFKYYCSRLHTGGWDAAEKKNTSKTKYVISPTRYKNCPPYSLRLRFETLTENGENIDANKMRVPKDDLKVGHARNKRTDANIQRRRERGRQKYREYIANRKEKEQLG